MEEKIKCPRCGKDAVWNKLDTEYACTDDINCVWHGFDGPMIQYWHKAEKNPGPISGQVYRDRVADALGYEPGSDRSVQRMIAALGPIEIRPGVGRVNSDIIITFQPPAAGYYSLRLPADAVSVDGEYICRVNIQTHRVHFDIPESAASQDMILTVHIKD